jgi:hypothetical protein
MRIACVMAAAAPFVLYIVAFCGSSGYRSWLTILGVIPPALVHLKNYLIWCKSSAGLAKLGKFGGGGAGLPEFDDGEGTYRRELRSAAPTRLFPPPLDPPPGFLADFGDTFMMMKSRFRFVSVRRFAWWFFCYLPLLEVFLLLVVSLLIKDQAADKNSDVSLIFTPGPTWAIRFFCVVNVSSVAHSSSALPNHNIPLTPTTTCACACARRSPRGASSLWASSSAATGNSRATTRTRGRRRSASLRQCTAPSTWTPSGASRSGTPSA